MLVSCLIFSFLAIWSATGIVWSMTDTDCSGHMRNCTFVVSILVHCSNLEPAAAVCLSCI